jgi:uncharacterized membrane protein YkgB
MSTITRKEIAKEYREDTIKTTRCMYAASLGLGVFITLITVIVYMKSQEWTVLLNLMFAILCFVTSIHAFNYLGELKKEEYERYIRGE